MARRCETCPMLDRCNEAMTGVCMMEDIDEAMLAENTAGSAATILHTCMNLFLRPANISAALAISVIRLKFFPSSAICMADRWMLKSCFRQ